MQKQDVVDFKNQITMLLKNLDIPLSEDDLLKIIEVPPEKNMGDYALPCFKLSKLLKKPPKAIADELALKIQGNLPDYLECVDSLNGYLNMFIKKTVYFESVLETILAKGYDYGSSLIGGGKKVTIDFSSPNIAKPFHVGHFKATILGYSLYNIYKFCGYDCIGINYLGDWGTQFGKLIVAYKLWGNKKEVEDNPIKALYSLYVKFHDEAEKDPSLVTEAQAWFKKMEDGDNEALSLWHWFKAESLEEFQKLYDILGVKFDVVVGESYYNDKVDNVVKLLESKNLLSQSEGAFIVDLEQDNMPPCLIKKSDGASLYATRDIAAALDRKEKYNFDKALYVVAVQQNLHFKQWFKVIELLGYDWYSNLAHVGFGMVSLETGTIKTRTGNVVFIEDVINKAVEKVKFIIENKNTTLKNKDEAAEKIAVGAMIFSFLSDTSYKDTVFSLDKVLDFNGETGPYLQYTYARICSLLDKAKVEVSSKIDYSVIVDDSIIDIFKIAYEFPDTILLAMSKNEPSIIAKSIMTLAQAFNSFYHSNTIITDDKTLMHARLAVVKVTQTILHNGLRLLGIEPLKEI